MENIKQCLFCKKFFQKKVNCSRKNWRKQKYCSRNCADKRTQFKKGIIPWNKGLKGYNSGKKNPQWKGGEIILKCKICNSKFSVKQYRKNTAKCCSRKCALVYQRLLKNRRKMSKVHRLRVKNGLHNLYKGVSRKNELIRKSFKYKLWRERVFKRDNWICWICGERGGKLHPHHLKKFSDYPKLRFIVSNGVTLCEFCHRTYTSFGKIK